MKMKIAALAMMMALPGLFSPPNTKMVAANGGTQVTLTGTSAVILKNRDGRTYAKLFSLVANTTNASCVYQTVYGTDPTAIATNIILVPGKDLNLCDGSPLSCFGGSVSCIAVSGSPVLTVVDY